MRYMLATFALFVFVGCMESQPPRQVSPKVIDFGILAELPDELSYLAQPAIEYGRFQFDDDIFGFLDSATDAQMAELSSIADRVRDNDHYPAVNRFLDKYPITDHEQAVCLYFLFGVMDHADLTFEPPVE